MVMFHPNLPRLPAKKVAAWDPSFRGPKRNPVSFGRQNMAKSIKGFPKLSAAIDSFHCWQEVINSKILEGID